MSSRFHKRELSIDELEKEYEIMEKLLKVVSKVMMFIDHKIVIDDFYIPEYLSYYSFGVEHTYEGQRNTIQYYREKGEIIKGILIGRNLTQESKYLGGGSFNPQEIQSLEEFIVKGQELFFFRNGKIILFERYSHDDYFSYYNKHEHHLKNPKELTVKDYLKTDSIKNFITNIFIVYRREIALNENKLAILKKSLNQIIKIREKYQISNDKIEGER